MRSKLIHKLMLSFIITAFVPLIVLSIFFLLFSFEISKKGFQDQAGILITEIAEDFEGIIEEYKHINYILSKNELIIELLNESRKPDKSSLLELYQELYGSMVGKLEEASAHVISLTETPSFSTHTIPFIYNKSNYNYLSDIFSKANLTPNKSFVYMNRYVNDKGNIINFSICKLIADQNGKALGYVIIDIFKSAIVNYCGQTGSR